MDVLGVELKGLLDSGSARTLVNKVGAASLSDAGLKLKKSHYACVRVANSSITQVLGEFSVPIKIGDVLRVVQVMYVPALSTDRLIGIDFWRRFNLRPDFVERTCDVGSVALDGESFVRTPRPPGKSN